MPHKPARHGDLGVALGLLREIRGVTQEQLAAASGVKLKTIKAVEQGVRGASLKTLGLLLTGLGASLETLGDLLATIQRLRSRTSESLPAGPPVRPAPALTAADLRRDLLGFFGPPPAIHRPEEPAGLEDSRRQAPALWERFRACPEAGQLELVRQAAEFQTAGFVERLCEESRAAAGDSAARAAHLAACAVVATALVPGSDAWRQRIAGYGGIHVANADRVSGDLGQADQAFTRAEEHWTAGADADPGLLNAARVLHLKAALRRDQRRLAEALALIERALEIDRWGETPGLLMSKAKALEELGRHDAAIALLRQADAQLDVQGEARDRCVVRQLLLLNLCHLGRHAEAELGFPEVRSQVQQLGNQLDLLRVKWLQGKIAAGRGRTGEAIAALAEVRAEFNALGNAYDTALVTLELAQVFASRGRLAEVKALARESAAVFEAQGVHREARQALALFRQAAEEERVSAELVRGVVTYLYRSRYDARVRYEAA
jgi:transcriptional regulator with XRE-family HTH domain/tetratricopeptide (TPR) repeat protein